MESRKSLIYNSYVRDIEERPQQMEESLNNSHDARKASRTSSEKRESPSVHDDSERSGHQRSPAFHSRLPSNVDYGRRIVSESSQMDANTSPTSNKSTNNFSDVKNGFAYSDGAEAIESSKRHHYTPYSGWYGIHASN